MASLFYYNFYTDDMSLLAINISNLFLIPLERLKILIQTSPVNPHNKMKARFYTGIYDCFKKVKKREGIRSLWRGASMHFLIFNFFIFFRNEFNLSLNSSFFHLSQDETKRPVHDFYQNEENIELIQKLADEKKQSLPSFFSRFFLFHLISHPFSVIRVNHAMYVSKNPANRGFYSVFDCINQITHKKGFSYLYRGFFPHLLFYCSMLLPAQLYANQMDIRELRDKYNAEQPETETGDLKSFLSYCNETEIFAFFPSIFIMAGFLFLDNLGARRMVINMEKNVPREKEKYSFFKDMMKIRKVSGMRKVYRGGYLNLLIFFLSGSSVADQSINSYISTVGK